MPKLIADCGSAWSKIKDLENGELYVCPTRQLIQESDQRFQAATGHLGRDRTDKYENELVALAQGSLKLVPKKNFTVVDIGCRDTKFVRFEGRKVRKLDWNQACGANTGFTLELLSRYYEIDYSKLPMSNEKIPVTCGIFAIERIFDSIIKGEPAENAVSAVVHGIAFNVYNFTQRPDRLYVSGGLCLNQCFMDSLMKYCEVMPLGRGVLLEGLY